jgi:HEAT repeat protein
MKKITKDYLILAGYHVLTYTVVGLCDIAAGINQGINTLREITASNAVEHAAAMIKDYSNDEASSLLKAIFDKKDAN